MYGQVYLPRHIEIRICEFDKVRTEGWGPQEIVAWCEKLSQALDAGSRGHFAWDAVASVQGPFPVLIKIILPLIEPSRSRAREIVGHMLDFLKSNPALCPNNRAPVVETECDPDCLPIKKVLGRFFGTLGKLGVNNRAQTRAQFPRHKDIITEVWDLTASPRANLIATFKVTGWELELANIRRLVGHDFDEMSFANDIKP